MPSTYSTALRLELIGNGEQAANWGNTTNTNLGNLIEQAITGVASVAMSDANYTLTIGNGVVDEARNAVLVMTGTLSATRSVIVPTSNKFYAVRNATSGGQSILVRTSGGTGVTLANGFTQLMYCDGTNVVLASVPINSSNGNVAVPGSATVAGNLDVTGTITTAGALVLPPGIILEYGGSVAPTGWLLCDGAEVSRTTYSALYNVIGTAYGNGDGSLTFNLPDRRDRFGVGAGSTYTRGSTGGAVNATTSTNGAHNHTGLTGGTTLTTAQIPSHTHTGTTSMNGAHNHGALIPLQVTDTDRGNNSSQFSIDDPVALPTDGVHDHTFTTDPAGGGDSHDHSISTDGDHTHTVSTISPYVASNYIIKI